MKYFSKQLLFTVLSAFIFVSTAQAGPRPDYKNVTKASSDRVDMLRAYPGNFQKPSPGGAASLKNYTSAMPPARLDSSFSSNSPYPTNKWYTSIFTNPSDSSQTSFIDYYGTRISPTPMTVIYDSGFPWSYLSAGWGGGWGYSLGGQIINTNVNDFTGQSAVLVNNIMALAVQGAIGGGSDDVIKAENTLLKSHNDWSFTAVLQDKADSSKRMTTTFGKGFLFTYNYFSPGVNPRLRMKYTSDGSRTTYFYNNGGTMTQITPGSVINTTDRIMIKNYTAAPTLGGAAYQYFGVYAPPNTTFKISATGEFCDITLTAASESGRYLSIALLKSPDINGNNDSGAFAVFNDYYQYAYNFVTDTRASWNFDQSQSSLTTAFNFTLDAKRTGAGFAANQTVFALYPHQWKNMVGVPNKSYTYNSIRGLLKVHSGNSFSTKHSFNGIVPFLTYEVPDAAKSKLQTYVDYDRTFNPANARIDGAWTGNSNTYYHGKALARAANLISVFHQHEDFTARDNMIIKLKKELATWYSGQDGRKYFGYDSSWGGIVGSNPGTISDFGASKYNDHHFHYGYFVYASAILAIYDPTFAESAQYKGMVDLLIKEFFNPYRNDASFPFLRNFDVYEGHSYANGRGGGLREFGNDEESTSEAMSAWSGIYLWGLATGNEDWINLAVYGYTTQYEATKNYYLNMDGDIWQRSEYNHASVGMLFDSSYNWGLWWDPKITQTVMGIQVLPLNPTMMYLGYNTSYAQSFYNEMWSRRNSALGRDNFWKDVWLRFKALFDASGALADWESAALPVNFPDTWNTTGLGDDGSSLSYSYHFIHFFNALGTVDTSYYADASSFLVMNKGGARTFFAFNPDKTNHKTVHFYKRTSASAPAVPNGGTMLIPPGAMAQTQDFTNFKYSKTDVSYEVIDTSGTQSVYSIYSDNFLGGILGGNDYQDRLEWDSWSGTSGIRFTSDAFSSSFEGGSYMTVTRTNSGWGAWAYRFGTGAFDMSAFYDGKIDVSIRIDSPSTAVGGFEIGFEMSGGGQVWYSLASLGFNQSLTTWQTLSIPLNSSFDPKLTEANLASVTLPFIMRHNSGGSQSQWGVPVHMDSILWKKANPVSNFSTRILNRSGNSSASTITWTISDFKKQNAVAQQYIEISLNNVEGNGWGIQIYTDSKAILSVSDPVFSGEITTTTVSGLINSNYPATTMLPMRWRPAPSTVLESEVFIPEWQDPWKSFRDVSAFSSGTGLNSGCDEIKFMDRRGFRYNAVDYGNLPNDKKIRLYFIADFSNAKKAAQYIANIVLEYFNE